MGTKIGSPPLPPPREVEEISLFRSPGGGGRGSTATAVGERKVHDF